jgi:hypothetical protein
MIESGVIPAQAGIQGRQLRAFCSWTPAFAGVTELTNESVSRRYGESSNHHALGLGARGSRFIARERPVMT